jgi:ubiquinone/menaquinone biosynthesis C-methylase UbiE
MVTNQTGFLDAGRVVQALGLTDGMHVGDFGAGSGYLSIAMAKEVGEKGHLYAVDVQEGPLESVKTQAQAQGLENVEPVRADLEVLGGTNIPVDALDAVLLANVLFQSQKKEAIVQEAHRTLKTGGHLLVIDWKKGAGGALPDEHRSEPETIKEMVQAQGFKFDKDVPAGSFYFGMLFIK